MTQQIIDTGLVANDGTGESLRNAFTAVNNNFANIWAAGPVDTQVIIYSNVVSTDVTNLDLRLAGNGIGTITVESTVVPSIDRVYDLGSPTKQYDSVYAQYFFGNGAFLTGISGGNGSASNSFSTITANGVNIVASNPTSTLTFVAGNNISILGNSTSNAVTVSLINNPVFSGNISTTGNIIGANVNTGNISLSGNILSGLTVSGNVTAPYFIGNGSQLSGVVTSLAGNLAGNINTGIYNLYSSNGAVKVDDDLSVVGTVTVSGGMLLGGPFATTANITANYFVGDGSQLTNLPAGNYSNANVAAYLPTYTGNITAGNVSTTGNIQGSYVLGNGSQLTGITTALTGNLAGNINTLEYSINSSNGEVRFGNTISVVGNAIIADNLLVGDQIATIGNVTANYFVGDGSQLTNLPAGNYSNANVAAYLPTYTGNVSADNFIGNGNALTSITGANVSGAVANATYATNANSAAFATNSTQATYATVANAVTGANVSGTVANATYALNSNASSFTNQANIANVANAVAGANVSGTVANATYAITANAATYTTYAVNATQANYANTANSVTGSNVIGIVANAVYAATSGLATSANSAGTAQYVTANAQANITSVGILTSLSSTGNITGSYILGNGSQLTGITSSLNGNLTGNINTGPYNLFSSNGAVVVNDALSVVGTITTDGGIISGGPVATTANITANYFIGDGSRLTNLPAGNYSNANVAAYLPTYAGNVSANNFIGNGATLTRTTGSNVFGAVANATYALNANSAIFATNSIQATYASVANSVAGANVSGTVANATYALNSNVSSFTNQANIANIANSVAGANVSGTVANATYALNANAATYATYAVNTTQANIANIANSVAGPNVIGIVANAGYAVFSGSATTAVSANTAQFVTANAQPNITSVGTLTSLSSTGNITAAYVIGNGSQLTGVVKSLTGNLAGNIDTLEYSINSSNGEVRFGNTISVIGNAIITDDLIVGDRIATTGNITTAANVYAQNFIGNVYGNIFANILVPGANTDVLFNSNGEANATSGLTFNKVSNVLTVGGNVSAIGNVSGSFILGNGSQLTGLPALYSNANVASYLPTYSGNITAGNVSASGNVTANGFVGNTASLTGNITSSANVIASYFVGNFAGNISGNLTVPGLSTQVIFNTDGSADATSGFTFDKITNAVSIGGNASAVGNITASYFIGNGSQLTGIDATLIQNGNSNVKVNANANVTTSVSGTSNVLVVANTGAYITGLISATGNTTSGNFNTAGLISATGNVNAGNINTGIVTATGNITGNNLNAVGLSLSGNVLSATNSTSNITTTANVAAGGILTDNYYYANGTPVDFEQPAGANTQIQFNDNNDFGATAAFTFDTAANALYVGGTTSVTGNVKASNLVTAGLVAADTVTSYTANANLSLAPNGTGIVTIINTDGGSTGIELGTPTAGALVSNAVTLTTSTSVTNGIAQLNLILGKLVPPSPPNFPNATTIALSGITTYRMANIVQVDNTPGANRAVAAGTSVANVLRVATYATNTVSTVGPGDSGIVTAVRNGANVGNVTLNTGASPTANGTYGGNLVITNNYDYRVANANIAAGFWYVFSAAVSGTTALAGWNELYIADSATGNTNTTVWYYDNSSPSAPSFSSTTMAPPGSANLLYSSTIPHYTNNNNFTIGFNVANVSGNTYPTSNTLASGSSGGAFAAPSSINYSASNIGSNILSSFASASANTTVSVTTGFGGSATGPSMSVNNSYSTGTLTLTAALGNTVLWKSGTATAVDEANVVIGSTIGTGSGNAFRIVNPGSGNTPAYTSNAAAFNSQTSTLETYDSTVVGLGAAGVLKHDQTNYATGYLPAGPNLSAGRTGTQYFTFKFVRTAVSKFDIRYTGTIAGMWVALPGSVIDSSSGANGWLDMSVAYGGAGYPGVNSPGNGSDGCALAGTVTLNSAVTNSSKTCTFGTVSSSSTATNEIYVRIALTSGQSVTALTLQTASN
jgi:hypothetical protein